jgi:hypothetical protein
MNRPNFEIEQHDQGLDRLGRKPLEPSPKVSGFRSELRRRLVVKMSAAATGVRRKSNLAPLQAYVKIPVFEEVRGHHAPP